MNSKRIFGAFALLAGFIVLQSTVLNKISIKGIIPDYSFILLIFISNSAGSMKGQSLGFVTGLVQDLISTSPIGFNCLIRTITGFIYGKTRGKMFLDSILLPIIFVLIATVLKELLSGLIVLVFMPDTTINLFDREFLIELGLNAIFAPLLFALLKLLKLYITNNKDEY